MGLELWMLLDSLLKNSIGNLLDDVVDMSSSSGRCHTIDKGNYFI